MVWHLPLAQSVILESWDRVPHRAPCMGPASPSACVSASLSLSLCVSHEYINKILKKKIIQEYFPELEDTNFHTSKAKVGEPGWLSW